MKPMSEKDCEELSAAAAELRAALHRFHAQHEAWVARMNVAEKEYPARIAEARRKALEEFSDVDWDAVARLLFPDPPSP